MNGPKQHGNRIGLALGSGSARGWAHVGVIRGLEELGISPEIVSGTSIGAFVGAAYAADQLDKLEHWVSDLTWREILNYMDLSLLSGGLIQGEKLVQLIREHIGNPDIESLPRRFAAVATELETGREVWFRQGPLLDGVRASIGLPGVFSPVMFEGRWLVDGGLTNPVPVSLCRAMGADRIIAVNLNGHIVGKHLRRKARATEPPATEDRLESRFLERVSSQLKSSLYGRSDLLLSRLFGQNRRNPGLFEVLASSINIMQDRITRSRIGGDPPEVVLTPQLSELGLMEFDQAALAIKEGHACVRRMEHELSLLL